MIRIAFVLMALSLAAGAGTAQAAPPTAAQVAKLTAQVTALQKQVKALQAQVKKDETAVGNLAGGILVVDACQTAIVADALQGTWAIVDQLLVAGGKPAAWGPQAPVNDFGACALFTTPITHGITTPANVTGFSALITLLHG